MTNNQVTYSVICCISLSGDVLPPFVMTPRKRLTSNFSDEYGHDKIFLYHQDNGFCDKNMFNAWLKNCFLVKLNQLRSEYNYHGECLLIMDGFSAHLNDVSIDLLVTNGISLKLLPPHSSHLLQPLDVLLFGPLKNLDISIDDISDDKVVNSINILLNKMIKTFIPSGVVK